MLDRSAILHIPNSQYAWPEPGGRYCIRLRAGRGDRTQCTLFYADKACGLARLQTLSCPMERIARDERFDWFEARIQSPWTRLCYYFRLDDGEDWTYCFGDVLDRQLPAFSLAGVPQDGRSEWYQYPAVLRTEMANVPAWMATACVYNVFPDSFADGRRALAGPAAAGGRLGGTLQGVTENLDHIAALGCNCLYLNPIFRARSYHKYDTIDYYHVDPAFGTDEDLRRLVEQAHARGVRVVLDGVFNHSGRGFFAFQDLLEKGDASEYRDWFYQLPAGKRPGLGADGRPDYACFAYEGEMPKLNTAHPAVQAYFSRLGRYWVEQFHIDGWRLDVANEVSKEFWRVFRREVKSADPDCVLIGEVWENARDWLGYDLFDSAMDYDFRRHCRDFFALDRLDAAGFNTRVTDLYLRYPEPYWRAQLNLLDSHDVCRFLSLCGGDGRRMRLAVLFQMLFPGTPCLYYGDEAGMTGVTEPEFREPMRWQEAEGEWFAFYQAAIRLRRRAITGFERFRVCSAEPGSRLFGYELQSPARVVQVWLNAQEAPCALPAAARKGESLLEINREADGLGPWGCLVCETPA